MNQFVRLILLILLTGAAVNVTVVVLANSHSRARQAAVAAQDREALQMMLSNASDHQRRMDFVVESQQVDARGKALETTLLVRQYTSVGPDQSQPLRVARVVIPGDEVRVEGILLEFDDSFASDARDYDFLRRMKLAYFGAISGKGDSGKMDKGMGVAGPEERFTLFPRFTAPPLTRLHPADARPTSFETGLWNYLWNQMPEQAPASRTGSHNGLEMTWLKSKPESLAVQREHTYTAFAGGDGVTIYDNFISTVPGLVDMMLEEAKELPAVGDK